MVAGLQAKKLEYFFRYWYISKMVLQNVNR